MQFVLAGRLGVRNGKIASMKKHPIKNTHSYRAGVGTV